MSTAGLSPVGRTITGAAHSAETDSSNERTRRRNSEEGEAGTGKSTVIQAITAEIAASSGERAFLLVAPTGATVLNIRAETIHSAQKLPTPASKFKELDPELERELQEFFAKTDF